MLLKKGTPFFVLVVGLILAANVSALSVDFDLTDPDAAKGKRGAYASSYSYSESGIGLNVSGWSNGGNRWKPWADYKPAKVGLFGGGLGVEKKGVSHTVDNAFSDYDFLLLSFDQEVRLDALSLGYIPNLWYLHDSDVSVAAEQDGGVLSAGEIYDANLGKNKANTSGLSSRYWLVGAYNPLLGGMAQDYDFDGFKLSGVSVSAVPIPGALWLLGSGLLALGSFRRKSANR